MRLLMQIIQVEMGMTANKIILLLLITFVSCKSNEGFTNNSEGDLYEIIEAFRYKDHSLYYKTIPYQKLHYSENFTYKTLNTYNAKYNSITEEGRFVNFDTIFGKEKRKEIDNQLKSLQSKKLKKYRLSNPEILSKEKSPYGTPIGKRKGFTAISFPFIVEADNGDLYGFIYRDSSMGMLYVFKKANNEWEEFARLEIWI